MAEQRVSGHVFLKEGKRGSVWYAKYRLPDGRQVQKKLGPAWTKRGKPAEGYLTERMAQEALDEILTDARRGTLENTRRSGAVFRDASAEYLRFVADVRKLDAGTVRDYRGVIEGEGYLNDTFGDDPIEAITPDDIDGYKEGLIAEGELSNRTIVRHLTVLHGIFNRAKRVWKLAGNPAAADLVERPKAIYTGEFDTYTRDEIELLATHAPNARDAALYRVAAYTGLRTGELFALRWECVEFVTGMLHVRRTWDHKRLVEKVPKGKRVRAVPMTPDVVTALAALKDRDHFTEDGDLVFCEDDGEHLEYMPHYRRYQRALTSAGLRVIRFHDLRHAFGTAAISKLDPHKVQSYMGHQHYSTTQRYLHHKPRQEDAAAIAAAFGGEPSPIPLERPAERKKAA